MIWLIIGLFILGAVCGASIRLMIFVGVLIIAATSTILADVSHGFGAAALMTLLVIVSMQIGYAAGFVLRAAIRSPYTGTAAGTRRGQPVSAPFGEKRR